MDASSPATPPLDRAAQARLNGARSTGPVTPEGKARSALNAVRHGLRSRTFWLLPEEDPAELAALRTSLLAELRPLGAAQLELAETVVECWWRLRRAGELEARIVADGLAAATPEGQDRAMRGLSTVIRYRARIEREREAALRRLAALQDAAEARKADARPALEPPAVRTNEPETALPPPLNRHERRRLEALTRRERPSAA